MNLLNTIILALVEGVTEFLPVSSTGHMILAASAFKIPNEEFVKTFEVAIQLGAVLAIVFVYSKQLIGNFSLYKKLAVAFIPTGLVGFFFYKVIKAYLFNPLIVAIALIVGGLVLIWVDRMGQDTNNSESKFESLSYEKAFWIGVCQSFAVIPGVSRAAATIIGGMFNGLSRKQATEFSFLLALPTMLAATGYDLLISSSTIGLNELLILLLGSCISFISAWFSVKLFIKFIDRQSLTVFGVYRIVLGLGFLLFSM